MAAIQLEDRSVSILAAVVFNYTIVKVMNESTKMMPSTKSRLILVMTTIAVKQELCGRGDDDDCNDDNNDDGDNNPHFDIFPPVFAFNGSCCFVKLHGLDL